jgi:hypothetical protein
MSYKCHLKKIKIILYILSCDRELEVCTLFKFLKKLFYGKRIKHVFSALGILLRSASEISRGRDLDLI